MTPNDSRFQLFIALWFSRWFSKSSLLADSLPAFYFTLGRTAIIFIKSVPPDRAYIGASLRAFEPGSYRDVKAIVQLG